MVMKEFLLWNNCKNNCLFCNMRNKQQSNKFDKISSIMKVYEEIEKETEPFSVLLVGGELFDDLTITEQINLKDLYKTLFINKLIERIYINTNLLYNISFLKSVLTEAGNKINKIHLTTSWDKEGRFKGTEKLFFDNLRELKSNFQNLKIIVNIIATKSFYEDVMNNDFNIEEKLKKFNTCINILPYIDVNKIERLKLTEQEFVDMLLKLKQQNKKWFEEYVDTMLNKEERIILKYTDKKFINMTAEKQPCGHPINFKNIFKDSDRCFGCLIGGLK